MIIHAEPSPLAGQTVKVIAGRFAGQEYRVEDWWDRVAGMSWMDADSTPAALAYAFSDAPLDNEVLYGKIGSFGHLIHVSWLESIGGAE